MFGSFWFLWLVVMFIIYILYVGVFIIIVKVVLSYNLFVTFVGLVSYSIVEGVFFFNLFWLPVVGG